MPAKKRMEIDIFDRLQDAMQYPRQFPADLPKLPPKNDDWEYETVGVIQRSFAVSVFCTHSSTRRGNVIEIGSAALPSVWIQILLSQYLLTTTKLNVLF